MVRRRGPHGTKDDFRGAPLYAARQLFPVLHNKEEPFAVDMTDTMAWGYDSRF